MAPVPCHLAQKVVCVMDAGGMVGAALVESLLRRGYTVHAARQGDPRGLLKAVPGGDAKRLKAFWSDPLDYQSLLDAVRGCSGLFYAFEPPPEQAGYDTSGRQTITEHRTPANANAVRSPRTSKGVLIALQVASTDQRPHVLDCLPRVLLPHRPGKKDAAAVPI